MAIVVRSATVDDAAAIALAHMRAWQVAYDGMVPAEYLDAMDLDARIAHWRTNLQQDTLPNGLRAPTDFVAEVDGTVVGFVNVGSWRQAPEDQTLAEIWAIYVHPDHWGVGAGHLLLQAAMRYLDDTEVATAYLWVLEDNERARRFYERQGWKANEVTQEEDIAGVSIIERRYSITLP